jgi:hypothetical protein
VFGRRLPDLPKAPRSFPLLTKPTGAICNLDCSYCFFLSKEELCPDSPFLMRDDLLEEYVRQLLGSHQDDEVTVVGQGGEPTMMRWPFFARSVELAKKHKRPDQRMEYTIQTNGTLLDDEWGAFRSEYDFLVGISLRFMASRSRVGGYADDSWPGTPGWTLFPRAARPGSSEPPRRGDSPQPGASVQDHKT